MTDLPKFDNAPVFRGGSVHVDFSMLNSHVQLDRVNLRIYAFPLRRREEGDR